MNNLPLLSDIATFVKVAEHQAFNKAARELDLTASAASKAVTRLEAMLGARLLRRTTRSVSLTPEGEIYLEGAKQALFDLRHLGTEVVDAAADPEGRLVVSVPPGLGRIWLVPLLADFHRLWPKIELELSLEDRVVDLAGDGIDVAIRFGELGDSANLVARKLFEGQLVVCATKEYWSRSGVPRCPADLVGHDCLNFRGGRTGRVIPWVFEEDGKQVSQIFSGPLQIDDGEAVGRAALNGAGVSQMPRFMAAKGLRSGNLVEALIDFRPKPRTYWAVYLDRRLVSARIRAFIDFAVKNAPS